MLVKERQMLSLYLKFNSYNFFTASEVLRIVAGYLSQKQLSGQI